jgi:outer membrane protein assembly factor BamB
MRSRRSTLALALFVAAASSACGSSSHSTTTVSPQPVLPLQAGSPWPKFRNDAFQDGVSPIHAHATGGALWSYQTAKGVFSSPVVGADGTIYVGSADRTFYALHPDGTLAWKTPCGELIDSAALLDDRGHVYFGSGDSKLRALDAKTGEPLWTMTADEPTVNGAEINWFEGNVGIAADGTLYAPNDNFFIYALDRDTGSAKWKFKTPNQTWSLPAIDPAGNLYVGNNNMVPILGHNTFAIAPDGSQRWGVSTLGTVAASPLLTASGLVVVGAFDGYVYAYDQQGVQQWSFGARDHVYASAALLPDGSIVAAAADGSLYDLDPKTGMPRWQFDTTEPIRSSPSVDADGNVYFGGGDGRFYVLGPDGKLRWSILLIDADRDDLNASPALGTDAIYIAGESGQIFSIPYEYCLRPEAKNDSRCTTQPPSLADGATLSWTTSFGSQLPSPPATIDPTRPITLTLGVRQGGKAQLAILDSSAVQVSITPSVPASTVVSGDGKFVTIVPQSPLQAGADGTVSIDVTAPYLVGMQRHGLALSGGTRGGIAHLATKPVLAAAGAATIAPDSTWTMTRLAVPLPTVMPSYNQIGFDSLWYSLSLVELNGSHAVGWMVGAQADDQGNVTVDPATKTILPLDLLVDGATLSMTAPGGITIQLDDINIPFSAFRMDMQLAANGQDATGAASLIGSSTCSDIPVYGAFMQGLGLCNPQTDGISFVAGANVAYHGPRPAISGLGTVTFSHDTSGVTATLTGSSLATAAHLPSLLLVDASTGSPVALGYSLDTKTSTDASGALTSVSIPFGNATVPSSVRVYLMIDATPAASTTITL